VRVTGLHHAGLRVGDLERSLHFYCDLLGIAVREQVEGVSEEEARLAGWETRDVRIADLDVGDGRVLELFELVGAAPPAAHDVHIALEVQDVDEAWRRVTGAGYPSRSQPVTLHDAGPHWTGATLVYVSDPDGTAIELVQPAPGHDGTPPPRVARTSSS